MPTNLYEATNGFFIVDVEGAIMASPNDFIESREPDEFKTTGISLVRDDKAHGFSYEFSDANKPYGFDRAMLIEGELFNPFELLLGIYSAKGVDGKAILRFLRDGIVQYEANIDFESFTLIDYKITLSARRINLDDLFRTRFETPVNFGATTSIDGTSITGLTEQSMFLHSKLVKSSFFADAVPLSPPGSTTTFAATNQTVYTDVAYVNITVNGIKDFNDNFMSLGLEPLPTFEVSGGGTMIINQISVSKLLSLGSAGNVAVELFYRVNDSAEVSIGGLVNLVGVFANTLYQHTFNNISIPVPIREAKGKNKIFIYIKVVFAGAAGIFTMKDGILILALPVTVKVDQLDADMFEVESNSFADVYDPFDSFNHVLEVINNGTNLLVSDFFTNFGNEIYLTNGYKIRDFNTRNLITDFKTLFEKWAQPMFGLGFAVFDDSGTAKVLIERYDHFYQDEEIASFSTIRDDSFESVIDKEIIFNEIKTGYKEFPKSTDENKNNNIDEFNTQHTYLTPIETIKKKKEYISEVIGSGYKIENQRIEQFKDIPEDTISDDDKIFCIKGVTLDDYTDFSMRFSGISTIDLSGTFFNLVEGEVITVSGTSNNNGAFTIQTIDTDLTGNTSFSLGLRLTVAEATIIETTSAGTITKTATFLRAERIEAMAVRSGVIDVQTVYNMGLNPKYFLFNQSLIINSGFNIKPDTAVIKAQDIKLNDTMTCKFSPGEGGYVLDPDKETIVMSDDLELKDLNSYNKLFNGLLFKFTTDIGYDVVLTIRDACLNQSVGSDNYGFITFTDPFGQQRQGFIMSMIYNPLSEEVNFVLRGKFDPAGGAFDELLDFPIS